MRFLKTVVESLLKLLSKSDRKKGLWIVFLLAINSLLDFFNVASFLPLIYGVTNPDFISSNGFLSGIYSRSGFQSVAAFLTALTGAIIGFAVAKNLVSRWIVRQKAAYAFGFGSALSSRALSEYMEINYVRFTQVDFSREMNRITNHPIAFANNIIMPLGTIFSEGILMLLLLACVLAYNSTLFLFLAAIIAPIFAFLGVIRKSQKETSLGLKEKYPLSIKYALQVVEGILEIKILRKEKYFKNRYDAASQSLARTFEKDYVAQTDATRLTETAAVLIIALIIGYALTTHQNYEQTVILAGIYAGVSFRLIPSINRILHSLHQLKTHEFLFTELDALHVPKVLLRIAEDDSRLPFSNKIELQNISFQYPNSTFGLQNISLEIHKGERVCLVGKSGSGKTTLLLILLRYLTGHTGRIRIDGNDVLEKDFQAWANLFGYVSQNPYILDGTLTENIAFGVSKEKIESEKIDHLIEWLDLTDLLEQLPDGADTRIGEKGVRLSGGQRQRIAIARALYANAEILLLDEITNHLDPGTEQEIMKTLLKVSKEGKTIITISHHSEMHSHFDRIIQLQDGVLQES
jgi:ABC-type multidrug transport system fused ATPase/permease subunit